MKNEKIKSSLKEKVYKCVAMYLALGMLFEYIAPTAAFALTSGPGQPEFSSFEPVGTTDMVDVYTGDFTYNIPLLSVPGPNGGYPINMAYHSGPGMDEEASWCGLGWNINVGAINRQLRGLPDDFNGDDVTHRYTMRPNTTVGINVNNTAAETFGLAPQPQTGWSSPSWQIYYNNYRGLGYRVSVAGQQVTPQLSAGVELSFDSQNGVGVEPDFTVQGAFRKLSLSVKAGAGYNSRQGLVNGSFTAVGGYGSTRAGARFEKTMDVPTVSMPMRTNVFPFGLHVNPVSGAPLAGQFHAQFPKSLPGYYSESQVANNGTVTSDAYGYLYNSNGSSDEALRDFQREPIEYSKKIPNLAPSSFTYDLYSQSGQGSGSQFRSYANNVGVLSDRKVKSNSYSYPVGIEFGTSGGANMHFGAGFSLEAGVSQSGSWQDVGTYSDIDFSGHINYIPTTSPAYQSAPFKVIGEKTGVLSANDHLADWGGDDAVKAKLEKSADPNWFKRQYVARNEFIRDEADQNGFQAGVNHHYRNQERERRGTNFEIITDVEVDDYGFTKNIGYSNSGSAYTNIVKTDFGGSRASHVSEITTVQSDGMRYCYGLPAYNNVQYDGSFAVNPVGAGFNTKTVAIPSPGGTWQPDASGTIDEFSQQTETGPYVHSWLLTSVVSYDYVDLSNNGPTEDDYGYWVRFNYNKTSSNYYWHVPYEGANYYEGKKGDFSDDRGSYSCGNREEYFLQSVETKTHIAIFYTSPRQDGIGAEDVLNGGIPAAITSSDRLYKLDSIKLYTKAEYYLDPEARTLRPTPVAIKTVHFRYSYDLCGKPASDPYYNQFTNNNSGLSVDMYGNVPASAGPNINANKGKLTLEKVFFTYQTSERGEFSPYVFDYGAGAAGSDDNPYYDPTASDRWGNYKKLADFDDPSNNLYPYVDNPWTDQTTTNANHQQAPVAGAWCLKKITVPSGSVIDVTYENDDYAYVEDQKAMRMFDIYDVGRSPVFPGGSDNRQATAVRTVNTESPAELLDGQYRVYFRLERKVSTTTYNTPALRSNYVNEHYLNNGAVEKIYFRAFMDLLGTGNALHKDYVSGYATIRYANEGGPLSTTPPFGLASSPTAGTGQFDLGYILLEGEDIQDPVGPPIPDISPFTKAGLQHLHFNRSELLHPPAPAAAQTIPGQIQNLLASVSTASVDISAAMVGFNTWAYLNNMCKDMDLNGRSIIRLMEPDGKKYGGGSRVKRITVNDNWDNDPSNTVLGADPDNYVYGIDYNYKIVENGDSISSGVCYEPNIGREESALTQPIEYTNSTLLRSDENLFLETPLLASYYPGAQVGYRMVTTKSIAPEKAKADDATNLLQHSAAPLTIYEFYTPKEFPVIFDETDINADPAIIRPVIIPGIYTSFTKRKARTQGYSIVLNDMAGKMRSVTQRTRPTPNNPTGTLIAKTEYIFFTEEPFSDHKKNKLSSKVQVLLDDGTYQTASVGQTHDIFIDMNENLETSIAGGLDANIDVTAVAGVPTFFPTINKKELSMRTVVVNKIINRTGIVKEVIATHEASTIKSENIAFDIETGEPLLTKTYNEHKDPVYSYSYPGHWYYDALEGGYLNHGMLIDRYVNNNFSTPIAAMTTAANGRIYNIDNYLDGLTTDECFEPGDELWVNFTSGGTDGRFHIIKVGPTFIDVIARNGQFIPTPAVIESIRIIRSGHDNMQSLSVGSLVTNSASVVQFDPQNPAGTLKTSNTSYTLNYFLSASAIEFMDIMTIDCTPECGLDNMQEGAVVDPYAIGIRGIWRPLRSYAYNTTRDQADDIQTDGRFASFNAFPWTNPASANAAWITAATVTKYSPYGFELENKDANDIYSSALYEYSKTLNSAVASNAQYKEIAFESFEDYVSPSECDEESDHWGFMHEQAKVVTTQAHTGKRSIKLMDTETVSVTRSVTGSDCEASNIAARLTAAADTNASIRDTLNACDCNGQFSPNEGEEYILMAWVKQTPVGGASYNALSTFSSPNITVKSFDGVSTTTIATSPVTNTEPVIDGWQRVFFTFTVPVGSESITVELNNSNSVASDDYFDDLRIQPYDANMVTYVYDPMTYRLVAQLDANNFAMFYIYDEQGGLEKMKVETKEGIKTVKEGRMNMDKH
jgi:hypothetical protein